MLLSPNVIVSGGKINASARKDILVYQKRLIFVVEQFRYGHWFITESNNLSGVVLTHISHITVHRCESAEPNFRIPFSPDIEIRLINNYSSGSENMC